MYFHFRETFQTSETFADFQEKNGQAFLFHDDIFGKFAELLERLSVRLWLLKDSLRLCEVY